MLQDESINEDEVEDDDGFCDIHDESSDDNEAESHEESKVKKEFQKFIKKISRPS